MAKPTFKQFAQAMEDISDAYGDTSDDTMRLLRTSYAYFEFGYSLGMKDEKQYALKFLAACLDGLCDANEQLFPIKKTDT